MGTGLRPLLGRLLPIATFLETRPYTYKKGHPSRDDLSYVAQRRPTLTGGDPQLPSALKSLTSVFGMGTGVTSSPSSLDLEPVRSKLDRTSLIFFG